MSYNRRSVLKSRGLVLRWVPYSNTSQVVTLFSRDYGILSLLAKGSLRAVRKSSSFPAPFDRGGWYDFVFRDRGRELDLATEARLIEGHDHLRRDLDAHLDASFAFELMAKLFRPKDPHPEFLHGALKYLKLLAVGDGRRRLRIHFVAQLLRESGIYPDWGSCLDCEAQLSVSAVSFLRYPAGVRCQRCASMLANSSQGSGTILPGPVRDYLNHEQHLAWGQIPALKVSTQEKSHAWSVLQNLLLHHLDYRPRSIVFLR